MVIGKNETAGRSKQKVMRTPKPWSCAAIQFLEAALAGLADEPAIYDRAADR